MYSDRTNDFTSREIEFCKMLEALAPQIKRLSENIRNNRIDMDHDHPLTESFQELEAISISFSEIYGGYWRQIDSYPTFDSFIDFSLDYLRNILFPSIQKLKEEQLPDTKTGMNNCFLSYLNRVENVCDLLFLKLKEAKGMNNKWNIVPWFKKYWNNYDPNSVKNNGCFLFFMILFLVL